MRRAGQGSARFWPAVGRNHAVAFFKCFFISTVVSPPCTAFFWGNGRGRWRMVLQYVRLLPLPRERHEISRSFAADASEHMGRVERFV